MAITAQENAEFAKIVNAMRGSEVEDITPHPHEEGKQITLLQLMGGVAATGIAAGLLYKLYLANPVAAGCVGGAALVTAFTIPIAKGMGIRKAIEGEVVQFQTAGGDHRVGIVESYAATTPGGRAAVRLLHVNKYGEVVFETFPKEGLRLWDVNGVACDAVWFKNRKGDPERKAVKKVLTAKYKEI